MWTEARDIPAMQEVLSGIIGGYEKDFAKHTGISEYSEIFIAERSVCLADLFIAMDSIFFQY